MSIFVSNTYQINTKEDGRLACRITLNNTILITYNPVGEGFTWFKFDNDGMIPSYDIFDLELTKRELEILREALETAGKQDLMGEITFIETENREETSFIVMMADKLERHKHEIDYTFFHKKPYYMAISPTSCHGNWKDARFIAVETFKAAGYDPSKYNFDVEATNDGSFIVTIK